MSSIIADGAQQLVAAQPVADDSPAERHERLRLALGGQNPPTHVALVWQLLHVVPRHAARQPGSAAWRGAVRDVMRDAPVYVVPTRPETSAAVAFLHQRALLPGWVAGAWTKDLVSRADRG